MCEKRPQRDGKNPENCLLQEKNSLFIIAKPKGQCRCSSMVEHDLAKVDTRVRFPSLAPVASHPSFGWVFSFFDISLGG